MNFLIAAALISVSAIAHAATPDPLPNFRVVAPGVFRGGQPEGIEGYEILRRKGVKTIINIQGDVIVSPFVAGETKSSRLRNRETARAAGYGDGAYYNMPVIATHSPSDAELRGFVNIAKLMNDHHAQPVYVHCNVGADRTGFIVAVYRIIYQNCSYAQAYREMLDTGHLMTSVFTVNFHRFMAKLAAGKDYGQERGAESCPLKPL